MRTDILNVVSVKVCTTFTDNYLLGKIKIKLIFFFFRRKMDNFLTVLVFISLWKAFQVGRALREV